MRFCMERIRLLLLMLQSLFSVQIVAGALFLVGALLALFNLIR